MEFDYVISYNKDKTTWVIDSLKKKKKNLGNTPQLMRDPGFPRTKGNPNPSSFRTLDLAYKNKDFESFKLKHHSV